MNIDKIRSMNDEELRRYLPNLSNRDVSTCAKCSRPADKIIRVENRNVGQTKQLCGLCDKHYDEFLDQLGVYDVAWR